MTSVEPLVERLYSIEDLVELRRNTLRYARAFPPGNARNQHRQVAVSLRTLFRGQRWLADSHPRRRAAVVGPSRLDET
jgi:hypothetical protein